MEVNTLNQTLANALAAFEKTTGYSASVLSEEIQLPTGYADAEILLCGTRFLVQIKKTLRPSTLSAALANFQGHDRLVLVTDYMATPLAEELKRMNIPFLDGAGNVYLNIPDKFIYVVGQKKPAVPTSRGKNRAFRAAGLKVIFTLLSLRGQLTAPTREIAYNAGVSNGTVGNTIKDLGQLGFVYRSKNKGLVLEQVDRLIDNWVEAYPRELRPQLKVQRFKIQNPDWWKEFSYDMWQKNQMWLGGEPAAALLTRYLHPEKITVYGRPDFKKLAQVVQQPVRDENGNFELLEPFWKYETEVLDEVYRICPPLLVYADLVAVGDARHFDAAQIIRAKYLHGS